ncbi:MAG: hypothetical protein FD149_2619 [Rhodospirillaceae bacterium]|nr:MAG: hypothetical protein FD149_2619 [Rhodospirillaceae bacterium]
MRNTLSPAPLRAIMMAAGLGRRLYGDDDLHPHKALLIFGGRSLLQRHVETLHALSVVDLTLVVGYHPEDLGREVERLDALAYVSLRYNPRFRRGSLLSLWTVRDVLRSGADILFMDADVLYHPALIQRLVDTPHPNCFLLDRAFEGTDEPVRLCLRDGHPVEFRKGVNAGVVHDVVGEWPGFLRLSPEGAAGLADRLEAFVAAGRLEDPYEEAIRAEALARPEAFGVEDITGLPWIEIDFPADVDRARHEILPRIESA